VQFVSQVQTGLQLQSQLWQAQSVFEAAASLEGFVFISDWVSSQSTEPSAKYYSAAKKNLRTAHAGA
jgi:hypothetical protein